MSAEPAIPVVAILFLATLIRSAFGFGEALVAVPLLALVIPVEVAAPVAVLVSITGGAHRGGPGLAARPRPQCGRALVLLTLPGIAVGLAALRYVSEPVVKTALAAVIIAFSAYSLFKPHAPRTEERPVGVAVRLRRRSAGRRVRHERSASGDLRFAAQVVAATFSRDVAGLFSAGELGGHGRLLAGGAVDSCGQPVLFDFSASRVTGDLSRAGNQSSPGGAPVLVVCSRRADRGRGDSAGAGDRALYSVSVTLLSVRGWSGLRPFWVARQAAINCAGMM